MIKYFEKNATVYTGVMVASFLLMFLGAWAGWWLFAVGAILFLVLFFVGLYLIKEPK